MIYCQVCKALREALSLPEVEEPDERCAECGLRVRDAVHLEQPPSVQALKVLCIDDNRLIRQVLADALAAHGFLPLLAPDGPTGIALAAAELPQLILVDIVLSGMDGFEVCRALRADARTAAIPLVILTARTDPTLRAQAFKAGADLALTKPVAPNTLMTALRAALSLKKGRPPGREPGSP
jgi:DNA-binding response OmpR family regulator